MTDLYPSHDTRLDPFAWHKFPKPGRCPDSPFKNGWHRCGLIPTYSVLDGGAPGDRAKVICLHCEKEFSESYFVAKDQPRDLCLNLGEGNEGSNQ